MKKVVLSLDGSSESRAATQWCIEHLQPGTEVIAVCGISAVGELVLGLPGFDQPGEKGVEEAFNGPWSEPLRSAGLECTPRLVHHTDVGALLEIAHEEHPDAIVVGKTAHGMLVDELGPRSRMRLVHEMPCAIVLVPDQKAD